MQDFSRVHTQLTLAPGAAAAQVARWFPAAERIWQVLGVNEDSYYRRADQYIDVPDANDIALVYLLASSQHGELYSYLTPRGKTAARWLVSAGWVSVLAPPPLGSPSIQAVELDDFPFQTTGAVGNRPDLLTEARRLCHYPTLTKYYVAELEKMFPFAHPFYIQAAVAVAQVNPRQPASDADVLFLDTAASLVVSVLVSRQASRALPIQPRGGTISRGGPTEAIIPGKPNREITGAWIDEFNKLDPEVVKQLQTQPSGIIRTLGEQKIMHAADQALTEQLRQTDEQFPPTWSFVSPGYTPQGPTGVLPLMNEPPTMKDLRDQVAGLHKDAVNAPESIINPDAPTTTENA